MRIQSFYNFYNHVRPVRTDFKSSVSEQVQIVQLTLSWTKFSFRPSVLGDVWGDAVFTYGLRKNLRLFGFSKQTGWAEGRQRSTKSRCACGSNVLNELKHFYRTVVKLKYLLCLLRWNHVRNVAIFFAFFSLACRCRGSILVATSSAVSPPTNLATWTPSPSSLVGTAALGEAGLDGAEGIGGLLSACLTRPPSTTTTLVGIVVALSSRTS